MANTYFTTETFNFLCKLSKSNKRDWFEKNKLVYEAAVRTPALQFITDMAEGLAMISPHFLAQPKKVGGSLMRIYRDVRFAKDKRPYKTNIGIHFRHERAKDVHAPGFYVHIEPGECFIGVGIWRPDPAALGKVRDAIVAQEKNWQKAMNEKTFRENFELSGDALVNPPRGYSKEHPLIHDLKRKDHIAICAIDDKTVMSTHFKKQVLDYFAISNNYMHFLCHALELRY